jgi:hypothetical protein
MSRLGSTNVHIGHNMSRSPALSGASSLRPDTSSVLLSLYDLSLECEPSDVRNFSRALSLFNVPYTRKGRRRDDGSITLLLVQGSKGRSVCSRALGASGRKQ